MNITHLVMFKFFAGASTRLEQNRVIGTAIFHTTPTAVAKFHTNPTAVAKFHTNPSGTVTFHQS